MTFAAADERVEGGAVAAAMRPPPVTRRRGVGPLEVVGMAWRAIRANVMRSVLTTLGIVIGVAAVVSLTSIGAGVTASITESLTSLGTNLLTVSGRFGGDGGGGLVRGSGVPTVTLADAEAIAASGLVGLAAVAPTIQTSGQVKVGALNVNATVIGTWATYATVRNSPAGSGTFFSGADVTARNRVAVLGYDVAHELFPAGGAVGAAVRIAGVSYTVLGVLKDKGASFNSSNTSVLVPVTTYLQRIGRQSAAGDQTVQAVYVQGTSTGVLRELQAGVERVLAARHGTLTPEEYDFQVQNQADVLASLSEVQTLLTLFLGSIAGISLVVGGIGIMNIMLVSVTERTREIGVRKALGARSRDVLAQFLSESVALSVGGGAIGVALGLLVALTLLPSFGLPARADVGSIFVAFAFAAVVGVFFGLYPARRAAALDPVEALRYE